MPAKEDAQRLVDELLPFAKQMLKEHHEFYPYGGYINNKDKIIHVGAKSESTDNPKSRILIDLLKQQFKEKALNGICIATAIISDVRIIPPDCNEKTDAIQVSLDHVDDYSIEVLFPYHISENGESIFGNVFAQKGNGEIFSK